MKFFLLVGVFLLAGTLARRLLQELGASVAKPVRRRQHPTDRSRESHLLSHLVGSMIRQKPHWLSTPFILY